MTENYKDFPKTIGEMRSDRSMSALDWSPRDALIDMLRDIDSGEIDPEALVIVWRPRSKDGILPMTPSFSVASKDFHVTLGMMQQVMYRMLEATES